MIEPGTLVQSPDDGCVGLVIEKHAQYTSIFKIRWLDDCDEWLWEDLFEVLS